MSHNTTEPVFRAYVTSINRFLDDSAPAPVGAWHGFPTTREALDPVLASLGANYGGVFAERYEPCILTDALRLPRTVNLDALNELAHRLAGMNEDERGTLEAVLQAGLHRGSLTELINLTHNLEHFDFFPGRFSGAEFGGILFEMHANEHGDVMERLQASDDPRETAFAAYVEMLEQSLDPQKYGELARDADGGILTPSGYLVPLSTALSQRYAGPEDIPPEHRLAENVSTPGKKPSLLGRLAEARQQASAAAARTDAPEKTAPPEPER